MLRAVISTEAGDAFTSDRPNTTGTGYGLSRKLRSARGLGGRVTGCGHVPVVVPPTGRASFLFVIAVTVGPKARAARTISPK